MKKRTTLSITLILALLMGLFTTGMAFASDGPEDEMVGIVIAIIVDEETGETLVEVDVDGDGIGDYTLPFGQGIDPETVKIVEGDEIVIKTAGNEDGDMFITELKIQERARDRVQLQDGTLESNFCAVEEVQHPVAAKLEETYGVPYEDIEGYLCGENHVPLGQIMLALATASIEGADDFETYLAMFIDGKTSWGQIWQALDLKGKPDKGVPPGQIKQQGSENSPDEAGPPDETPGNK